MKLNKVAGFWIRLLGRLLDMVYVGGLIVLIGWLTTTSIPTEVQPDPNVIRTTLGFGEPYLFYVWAISTMLLFAISFIVVPLLSNGRTLGMLVCRIKIKFEDKNKFLSIIKREMFFSLAWIWSTLMLMTIINHTMINEFAQTNQSFNEKYDGWESARIAMLSVFTSFPLFIMFGCAISIVVRNGKTGFHDTMSNTTTVWENKFTEPEKEKAIISIQPLPVKNNVVEWIK